MNKFTLKNNRVLAYNSVGSGECIIFLHSYLWDSTMWNSQIDLLKDHYTCISIDLYGHGESGLLENSISLEELASDIKELIDSFNLDRYSLVGLSVGGMLIPYIHSMDNSKIKEMVIMDSYSGIGATCC
ncbi:MAG: alpha/beta fold hydrolase [Sarcina sp.]